jgi:FkbM family methyltransferase
MCIHNLFSWDRVSDIPTLISQFWVKTFNSVAARIRRKKRGPVLRLCLRILLSLNRRMVEICQLHAICAKWELSDGTRFYHAACDDYWERSSLSTGSYESELLGVLIAAKDVPYVFLDCGANFGYWSALVSSEFLGSHRAVAIEASPVTFQILVKTATANQERFQTINNALSSKSGELVQFEHRLAHAGSRVSGSSSFGSVIEVETVSLDCLVAKHVPINTPVIVKLDVEGQEIASLEGARSLLELDVMFLYEDHGDDPLSAVTAKMLDIGFLVFWPGASGSDVSLRRIYHPQELISMKKNPHRGYNLVAIPDRQSSVWRRHILV